MWGLVIGVSIIVVVVMVMWYAYCGQYIVEYHKAKKEIIPFIESYKKRISGDNRFVVTAETLQDSFREYDIRTIKKVWMDLIELKLIEKDVIDGEWCVK